MLPKVIRQQAARSHVLISSPCSSSRGGGRSDRRALAVEPQRRCDERDAVESSTGSMPELGGQRERLVDPVDRADRHAGGAQRLHPVVGRLRAEDAVERARRARRRSPRAPRWWRSARRRRGRAARSPRTGARTGGRCRRRPRTAGRRPRRSRTGRCSGGGCRARDGTTPPDTHAEPWLSSDGERRVHQRDLDVAPAAAARARPARPGCPIAASSPHTRSITAAPAFSGRPSGSPVTLMSPPIACSRKS